MRKNILVLLLVTLMGLLLLGVSGCGVTVTPGGGGIVTPPLTGQIQICTYNPSYYGELYIDGVDQGVYIDGSGWAGPNCSGWINVTLNQTHTVELWDSWVGTTYFGTFTPTFSGQTITLW
ncbi:MAG: hypothetical protein J7J32_01255 [Candidatus Atribacteria bacterium]|nr:hypothetical protein [Candidatus Atribacteria bacterium]MCD6349945.1 hypothetical protein [Candidatus Atribacteria bacterium]